MTVQSTSNIVIHVATVGQDTYAFDYLLLQDSDMHVYLGGTEYLLGFTVTGIGNQNGGSVILDDPITAEHDGKQLSLVRLVPLTQETDYHAYDGFPPESHERALDKLTMIGQQNTDAALRSLRLPIGDSADVVYPTTADRAEKYAYFDEYGNATAIKADIAAPAVLRIDIQDGQNGEDSRTLLNSEVISGGANHPKIGFININKPNGPLKLNDQGHVSFNNIGFSGMHILGPYRGDDECPKPDDAPDSCVSPDTRNPSERFPQYHPNEPGELGKFNNGDVYIISMAPGESSGTMNLFVSTGSDVASEIITVYPNDGILFLTGWDDDGADVPTTTQGWYHISQMIGSSSASSTAYDDDGNTYVLGSNVQLALDATDNALKSKDEHFLTLTNSGREALDIPINDANGIVATGFYQAVSSDANLPSAHDFSIIHTQISNDTASQVAIRIDTGRIYVRSFNVVWTSWLLLGLNDDIVTAQARADEAWEWADTAQGYAYLAHVAANERKLETDFIRVGADLHINNVRIS